MMAVVQYLLVVLAYTLVSQVAGDDWKCCDKNEVKLDFNDGTYETSPALTTLPDMGIKIVEGPTDGICDKCDWQVVLKIAFNQPSNCSDFCAKSCTRRMLKIGLTIDPDRQGYIFNVGNSKDNTGDKGDDPNTRTFDSNIVIYNNSITAHSNDNCTISNQYSNTIATAMTITIASGYYRIQNNDGLDVSVCNEKCFFDFFGRYDDVLNVQNDFILYIGFNKVIKVGSSRIGKGVCSAKLSWECCE